MNNLKDKYSFDYSYVEISTKISSDAQELDEAVFQFEASYYIQKKIFETDDDYSNFEDVLAIHVLGHTADFDYDYIYATDAISESAIENYAFAKGLYEELFHSEFHDEIIGTTGQVINRWLTLENVWIGTEFGSTSEIIQSELFTHFLSEFKKTWLELFHGDVNLISFNESLYVSEEEKAQKNILLAYQRVGFYPTLNRQKLIEDNSYTGNDESLSLKEIFKLDVNNNLFGENIKNPKRIHYSGIFYKN